MKEQYYYFAKNDSDRVAIDQVMQKYPAKISPFLQKLLQNSDAIRRQYLPMPNELKTAGTPTPFEEGKKTTNCYGVERVYRDRVLITPYFDCPAYCRFCYKKSRVMREKREMTYSEIDAAVTSVETMQDVRGVLITGGEPFMNIKKLFYLLDKVFKLDNIYEIRIGTRALLTMPNIFTSKLCDKLADYNCSNTIAPEKSKSLAINVHFNHPDELAPAVMQSINRLTARGIILRNQTVLLKDINDDAATIKRLFSLLLRNRIIPYYMNHCMPVESSDHLRTTVQKGLDIYNNLCTESATIIPHYVFAPAAGKVHVGAGSKFAYKIISGRRYVDVKMLYKAEEFTGITKKPLPAMHSVDKNGYILATYLDGDED